MNLSNRHLWSPRCHPGGGHSAPSVPPAGSCHTQRVWKALKTHCTKATQHDSAQCLASLLWRSVEDVLLSLNKNILIFTLLCVYIFQNIASPNVHGIIKLSQHLWVHQFKRRRKLSARSCQSITYVETATVLALIHTSSPEIKTTLETTVKLLKVRVADQMCCLTVRPRVRAPSSSRPRMAWRVALLAHDNCSSKLVASSRPSSEHDLDVNTCNQASHTLTSAGFCIRLTHNFHTIKYCWRWGNLPVCIAKKEKKKGSKKTTTKTTTVPLKRAGDALKWSGYIWRCIPCLLSGWCIHEYFAGADIWWCRKELCLQCAYLSKTNRERPEFDHSEKICASSVPGPPWPIRKDLSLMMWKRSVPVKDTMEHSIHWQLTCTAIFNSFIRMGSSSTAPLSSSLMSAHSKVVIIASH